MIRAIPLPLGSALLGLLATLSMAEPVRAQEAGASAEVSTSDKDTGSAARPDMDAPGRSTVPAPAYAPLPRVQRRTDFSAQNMAVELRFGPYVPRIDEGTTTAVRDGFFGDKKRLQLGFEFDAQLWRAPYVGTLGVGLGWAYTRLSGRNKSCLEEASSCESEPPEPTGADETDPIAQKTTFNIMPMYVVGVLRVDVLARELSIPLVGYGKFGLGYALWWINDGTGIADFNGYPAKDTSVGTQAALGAMFLLDVLEPSAGRELDAAAGINNSYVFVEWSVSDYNRMNVGSNTWVTGLAAEF